MEKVYFSILKYQEEDFEAGPGAGFTVPLAIIVLTKNGHCLMIATTDYSSFDKSKGELDVNFLPIYLEGMAQQIKTIIKEKRKLEECKLAMEEYSRFFCTTLKFTPWSTTEINSSPEEFCYDMAWLLFKDKGVVLV